MHCISHLFPFIITASAVSAANPALKERDNPCPYEPGATHTIMVTESGTQNHWALKINYLGRSTFGCVYGIESAEGSPAFDLPAVAKVPRVDGNTGEFDPNDVGALLALGELYAQGHDANGHEWIVMEKQPGKIVTETEACKEMFPGGFNVDYSQEAISTCIEFMHYIYELIAAQTINYARASHYNHGDWNWGNYLFNDDLTVVKLIDWSNAYKIDPDTANFEAMRDLLVERLETFSVLPIRDCLGGQGICDSVQRRVEGITYENPLLYSS